MREIIFLMLAICCATSCFLVEKKQNFFIFEDGIWNSDSIVSFDVYTEDTVNAQSLSIQVRHDIDYDFQNLLLFVYYGGKIDTLDISLCRKNGRWLGKGIGGIRKVNIELKDKIIFQNKKQNISIEQAMRYGNKNKIQNLSSILSIGISIIELDE